VNAKRPMPRLLIAGVSGGSGKTIVTMGLLLLLRRAGVEVRAFKKGPDYIDPAWLAWASANPARNLDAFLMGIEGVRASFRGHGITDGINLIEGNRGFFDGVDAAGTYSSAALAGNLDSPSVLVMDATKMTRTAAAIVLGCQKLDPNASIQGVVLNNVSSQRHERIIREAIEQACSIPVIGALPRLEKNPLPERHLGLVPPEEHERMDRLERCLLEWMESRIDVDAVIAIARSASPVEACSDESKDLPDARGLRIGYVRDSAFSFYYPENLEELERAGAELIRISAVDGNAIPSGLHALYVGGGFPEMHAKRLSENSSFLGSLSRACANGLPVYAECGGLILLARSLKWSGTRYSMANVFPIDVEGFTKPQGHGYSELRVDGPNPFFAQGAVLRGHEFHYSRIDGNHAAVATSCTVVRGAGCFAGRDCLVSQNVMASYTHLHETATPEWAAGMVAAARRFAGLR